MRAKPARQNQSKGVWRGGRVQRKSERDGVSVN